MAGRRQESQTQGNGYNHFCPRRMGNAALLAVFRSALCGSGLSHVDARLAVQGPCGWRSTGMSRPAVGQGGYPGNRRTLPIHYPESAQTADTDRALLWRAHRATAARSGLRSRRHSDQLGTAARRVGIGSLAMERRKEVVDAFRLSAALANNSFSSGARRGREGSAEGSGNRISSGSRKPEDFLAVTNFGGRGKFSQPQACSTSPGGLRQRPVYSSGSSTAPFRTLSRLSSPDRFRIVPGSDAFGYRRTGTRCLGGVLRGMGGGSARGKSRHGTKPLPDGHGWVTGARYASSNNSTTCATRCPLPWSRAPARSCRIHPGLAVAITCASVLFTP